MIKRTRFTAYITQYALTTGIEAVFVEDRFDISPHMVACIRDSGSCYLQHYQGNNWHRTMEEAIARADEMRVAKIRSLRKSIQRLEALDFTKAKP